MAKKEKSVGKISGITPCGSQVLVEVLTDKERLGTSLEILDSKGAGHDDLQQAYVVALGPAVAKEWGFKAGDRVIISGTFCPTPDFDRHYRKRILLEPHCIKACLLEE